MRLTHHPAMLHDNNVGIEWSWWRVNWRRGKRPLKVTHWAGSSARIPIHCDLSLRETKQYPIKLHTKLSDCYPKERVMQHCHPRNNYQLSGTQPSWHLHSLKHKTYHKGSKVCSLCTWYLPSFPCVCCPWRILSWEGDREITVKAMKMAQTRFAHVWQQYKMRMAAKAPNTVTKAVCHTSLTPGDIFPWCTCSGTMDINGNFCADWREKSH